MLVVVVVVVVVVMILSECRSKEEYDGVVVDFFL